MGKEAIDWQKVDQTRAQLQAQEPEGKFVGYNDPGLTGVLPRTTDPRETSGVSGTVFGFAFGGAIFPDSGRH